MPTTPRALPAELSIYTVGELHPQWLAWLSEDLGGQPLVLDGGPVEQADAAGVQLLMALTAALNKRGSTMAMHDASPALLQACSALGLAEWADGLRATNEQSTS